MGFFTKKISPIWNENFKNISHMSHSSEVSKLLPQQTKKVKELLKDEEFKSLSENDLNFFGPDDLYIESACVIKSILTSWDEECKWLRESLKLMPFIQHMVDVRSKQIGIESTIGVHVRMGQPMKEYNFEGHLHWDPMSIISVLKNRKASNYLFFMDEIERMWKQVNQKQKFFLCADNSFIYQEFIKRFPEMKNQSTSRIVYIERTDYDRSLSQIVSGLLDVYLLSKTKYLLGSSWSSYTELATRLGHQTGIPLSIKYSGKDFAQKKFGAFMYNDSYNLGDCVQTLAAIQHIIPDYRKDLKSKELYFIDRDAHEKYGVCDITGKKLYDLKDFPNALFLISNGW